MAWCFFLGCVKLFLLFRSAHFAWQTFSCPATCPISGASDSSLPRFGLRPLGCHSHPGGSTRRWDPGLSDVGFCSPKRWVSINLKGTWCTWLAPFKRTVQVRIQEVAHLGTFWHQLSWDSELQLLEKPKGVGKPRGTNGRKCRKINWISVTCGACCSPTGSARACVT